MSSSKFQLKRCPVTREMDRSEKAAAENELGLRPSSRPLQLQVGRAKYLKPYLLRRWTGTALLLAAPPCSSLLLLAPLCRPAPLCCSLLLPAPLCSFCSSLLLPLPGPSLAQRYSRAFLNRLGSLGLLQAAPGCSKLLPAAATRKLQSATKP